MEQQQGQGGKWGWFCQASIVAALPVRSQQIMPFKERVIPFKIGVQIKGRQTEEKCGGNRDTEKKGGVFKLEVFLKLLKLIEQGMGGQETKIYKLLIWSVDLFRGMSQGIGVLGCKCFTVENYLQAVKHYSADAV